MPHSAWSPCTFAIFTIPQRHWSKESAVYILMSSHRTETVFDLWLFRITFGAEIANATLLSLSILAVIVYRQHYCFFSPFLLLCIFKGKQSPGKFCVSKGIILKPGKVVCKPIFVYHCRKATFFIQCMEFRNLNHKQESVGILFLLTHLKNIKRSKH